jgi:hypothetical protein
MKRQPGEPGQRYLIGRMQLDDKPGFDYHCHSAIILRRS